MKKLTENDIKLGVAIAVAIVIIILVAKSGKLLAGTITGIGEGLGITDTAEEKKAKKTTDQAIKDFSKQAAATSKPTRSAAQWAFVADTIYNALKSSAVSDDKPKAYGELARILTDADMALVISAFGKRQEYSFGVPIGQPKTLAQFVNENFSQDDIDTLNGHYSRSQMKWKF